MSRSEAARSRVLRAALIAGAWTTLGIVSAIQIHVREATDGYDRPWRAVFNIVYFYWAWAVLTPFVLRLARAIPARRRGALLLLVPAAVILVAGQTVLYALFQVLDQRTGGDTLLQVTYVAFIRHLAGNLFTLAVILAIHWGLEYYRRSERRELALTREALRASELEATLQKVQREAMISQLRPHFLFNTLNMIGALIAKHDDATATRVVARLGDLLRETFASSGEHESSLANELRFTRHYLEIAQLRVGPRLRVTERIDPGALSCRVPRFILQPLVENALIHGMGDGTQPLDVVIHAFREDAALVIEVRDNGPGFNGSPPGDGSGLGLSIVRDRMSQLYANRASVALSNAPGGGAMITLRLPAVDAATLTGQ